MPLCRHDGLRQGEEVEEVEGAIILHSGRNGSGILSINDMHAIV
jgi:hypothetical protein